MRMSSFNDRNFYSDNLASLGARAAGGSVMTKFENYVYIEDQPLNDWVIFFQNVISLSDVVHLMCDIFIWNWSNAMNI